MASQPPISPAREEAILAAVHDLANATGALLGNWFVLRDYVKDPDALVIAADIDVAGVRLEACLRRLRAAL